MGLAIGTVITDTVTVDPPRWARRQTSRADVVGDTRPRQIGGLGRLIETQFMHPAGGYAEVWK
jgi:hypothetical protein